MLTPPNVASGRIHLITGPRPTAQARMHTLAVQYALAGPLRLLVGGNHFDVYEIAYALAARSSRYYEILEEHILLARAETCYQMAELLKDTQASPLPTLVMDFLAPFYEEGMAEKEVDALFFASLQELRRLCRQAVLVVGASPHEPRLRLLKALEKAAGQVERCS